MLGLNVQTCTLQVMDARLRELVLLLPDLAQKLPVMQVKAVALMAADTQALATKLLALRRIFPSASVSQARFAAIAFVSCFQLGYDGQWCRKALPREDEVHLVDPLTEPRSCALRQMVVKQPQIVLERSLEDIESSALKLGKLLPGLDVDRCAAFRCRAGVMGLISPKFARHCSSSLANLVNLDHMATWQSVSVLPAQAG